MKYTITRKQEKILNAVYAGIWTLKHSSITLTDKEKAIIKDCIKFNFEELDQLQTPFIIQNIVISIAEIKSSMDNYFETNLNKKGIEVL